MYNTTAHTQFSQTNSYNRNIMRIVYAEISERKFRTDSLKQKFW